MIGDYYRTRTGALVIACGQFTSAGRVYVATYRADTGGWHGSLRLDRLKKTRRKPAPTLAREYAERKARKDDKAK